MGGKVEIEKVSLAIYAYMRIECHWVCSSGLQSAFLLDKPNGG